MTRKSHPAPEWTVLRYGEVTSTMEVAADLSRAGAPAGTVVVATHQTSGRGQRGRIWLEQPGTCLLTTIILRPAFRVATDSALSRRIAERVGQAIESTAGLVPTVKEPNDLLIGGRKVCGILCQTSIRGEQIEYLLVGIGLNVNQPRDALPLDSATSLLAETGRMFDFDSLLAAILDELPQIPGLCGCECVSESR